MVLAAFLAGAVVAGMVAAAAASRDSARRRREWRADAAAVRERNLRRAQERATRFEIPAPRESRESRDDSGYWLVDR